MPKKGLRSNAAQQRNHKLPHQPKIAQLAQNQQTQLKTSVL